MKVSTNISLEKITPKHTQELYNLMCKVYPPAYQEFWNDDGSWYINSQYSKENILKELKEKNAEYYFVLYRGKRVGNFRFIWNEQLKNHSTKKTVKLHRIYLHKNTQGNGIGKQLLSWLAQKTKAKNYELIWLDAMEQKPQALLFYKKLGYRYYSHCFLEFPLLKDSHRKMNQLVKEIE